MAAVVHQDAAAHAHCQTRLLRKVRVRRDTNGQHYHVSWDRISICEKHFHAIARFAKAFHGVPERQLDAMLARLGVDECRHVGVEGLHELLRTLHDSDLHADLAHVLGQLKPDETTARDHCRARMVRINEFLHTERIFHGTQRKDVFEPHSGKARLRGLRTR